MAIGTPTAVANWTLRSTTSATAYSTVGLFQPLANRLYTAAIIWSKNTPTDNVSITVGGGLTWVKIANEVLSDTHRISIYAAIQGSDGTSTLFTIDFGIDTQTGAGFDVFEWTGTHTTTANAVPSSNAVTGQVSGATITLTYPNAWASGSAGFAAFVRDQNSAIGTDTDWTELTDSGYSSPGTRLACQYRLTTDTNVTTGATSTNQAGIAVEIVEAAAAGGGKPAPHFMRRRAA